jgi:hypothetical protein
MKYVFGAIVGVAGTLFVQKLYNKHGNFYAFVNGVKQDVNDEGKTIMENVNVFDKLSLIYRRI